MYPPTGTQQVAINTRTLRIGHQTYQLQNLARVQTVKLQAPPDAGKGNGGLAGCLGVVLFFVVVVPLASAAGSGTVAVLGIVGCAVLAAVVYQKTRKSYVPLYALMLETTGNPQTALVSPDRSELDRLSSVIVDAIENPPSSEQHVSVHNVILGDQYNQSGKVNVGKIGPGR